MQAGRKIAVAGTTGRVGCQVVDVLRASGYNVVAMSRSSGVDVITGDGLTAALDGAEAIIDVATGPSPDQQAATEFFADEGPPMTALLGRLIAAQRAGQAAAEVPLGFLVRLQRAFDTRSVSADPGKGVPAAMPGLVEPLTSRELEVLEMLTAGGRTRPSPRSSWSPSIPSRSRWVMSWPSSTASSKAARLDRDVAAVTPESLCVYGSLLLCGAIAAAEHDERDTAPELLTEVGDASRQLGAGANLHRTAFGLVNAHMHLVNIAVTLGDAGTAIDVARRIDLSAITVTERKDLRFELGVELLDGGQLVADAGGVRATRV